MEPDGAWPQTISFRLTISTAFAALEKNTNQGRVDDEIVYICFKVACRHLVPVGWLAERGEYTTDSQPLSWIREEE
jgi:hypothetical protein